MKQLLLSTLALMAAAVPATAFEADLDGTTFDIDTVYCQVVGPGVTRSHLVLTAPGRSVNVYTSTLSRKAGATPGVVEPRVIIGKDQARTGESLSSMATRHDRDSEYRYLTGINGDFFITSSFASQHEFGQAILGYPNMACAIDGCLAAPDMIDVVSRENALITTADTWYIDATDFKYRLLNNDGSVKVDAKAVNYPRRDEEMVVYNHYMGASTSTSGGRELLLRMAEGAQWNINKSTKFIVEGEWTSGGNMAIPADGLVISCGPAYSNEFIDGLKAGDIVKLKIVVSLPAHDAVKPEILNILGGDVRILNRGEITREAIRWINTPSAKYQRSVVGFSEDRDMMVFAAVDGAGLTYFECAGLLKALGCYDGLDLDGGGSTAIWSKAFGIYNQPRDGSERAIGNGLYFAMKTPKDTEVASLRFADHAVVLPRFGSYTPVVFGYNSYGELVDTDVKGFTLSAPEALGVAEGSTLLASGEGTHALTATLGNMTTTVAVTIDDNFPAVPRHTALLVDNYHAAPIELFATVRGKEMPVAARAFEWSSDNEAVATVDAEGRVSGHADGSAVITGTRGDISFTVDITVQCPVAREVSLLPDLDASAWRTSASAVTVKSFAVSEDPAMSVDFTIKNGPAHKITARRTFTLYSCPDAVKVTVDPAESTLSKVNISLVANGGRPVSVDRDVTPGQVNELLFTISDFADVTDPGIYPLSFQNIVLEVGSTAGDYHLDIKSLELVYDSYVDGVESVVADKPVLNPQVTGDVILLPAVADFIELHDLTGRVVDSAAATASIAVPAPGLYILTAVTDGRALSCKLIIR